LNRRADSHTSDLGIRERFEEEFEKERDTGLRPDWKEKLEKDEDPCWEGYTMVGTKVEDGEEVPNCVPEEDAENYEASVKEDDDIRELAAEIGDEYNLRPGEVMDMLEQAGEDPDKSVAEKQVEVQEGLSWSEEVEIVEVDEENGMVRMRDRLTGSEWNEDMADVQEKLDMLEDRDHEWLYDLVSEQYATMEPQDVSDLLHDAEGIPDEDVEGVEDQ